MLKRLAIFAVLLASLGNLPPIPGQTANHGSQTAQKPEKQTDTGKNPDKPTLVLIEKKCDSDQFKNDADCKKAENNESAVSISKLPTANVTIQSNAKRDFPDWVTFWVSFALAIVGFGGVGVGIFTVLYIKRQTFEMAYQRLLMRRSLSTMRRQSALMEKQTEILDKSVAAAKTSADAANAQIQMVKDKERARVSVSMSDKEFVLRRTYFFDKMTIKIANDGTTSAFNVKAKGHVTGQPSDNLPSMWIFLPLVVPNVIRANNEPIEADVFFLEPLSFKDMENSEIPYFLHVGGVVEYEDVFGDSHKTTFRYRLRVSVVDPIPGTESLKVKSFFEWGTCGSLEENYAA
jgi:hypothetical protein